MNNSIDYFFLNASINSSKLTLSVMLLKILCATRELLAVSLSVLNLWINQLLPSYTHSATILELILIISFETSSVTTISANFSSFLKLTVYKLYICSTWLGLIKKSIELRLVGFHLTIFELVPTT